MKPTFLDFLIVQLAKAYGAHYAPLHGRGPYYFANIDDAARAQRLEAERLVQQNDARIRYSWESAA